LIHIKNDAGEIRISSKVISAVAGGAVVECYGVKGMAMRSDIDGLVHLLRRESVSKGVKVVFNEDKTVSLDLHIMVENGVNMLAIAPSIINGVRYVVNKTTGAEVRDVNIFIDSLVIG
jgi:uncharacterized alkaline shock family protein YloU